MQEETKKKTSAETKGAKKSTGKTSGKSAAPKQSGRKSVKERLMARGDEFRKKREAAKKERLHKRADKERAAAEKRIELAKIKAERKTEREKARNLRLREKNKRKNELKKMREQRLSERQKRRDMLKSETKAQRAERIKEERAEKLRIRNEKRELKAQLKKEKMANRRAQKEARRKNKQSRKGYGGWLAAVISLGASVLVLTGVLTYMFFAPTANDVMLENSYQKSFYDMVNYVDNIDLNLSKLIATTDGEARQEYLIDLAVDSELAENGLQQLPIMDEAKFYTSKLINQIGDYSKYLNKKLINNEQLSADDVALLRSLYSANLTLKNSLKKTLGELSEDYNFSNMLSNAEKDPILINFNELQNISVEYPEMIYDGPFSDGASAREVKGLTGKEISQAQAREKFNAIWNENGIDYITDLGETTGQFECYNFGGKVAGNEVFGQISKKGGKLIMYSEVCNPVAVNFDKEDCTEIALNFLANNGFLDMKPVWIDENGGVVVINFAYEQEDVIVYSDLIKVKVCQESGRVSGFEANNYFLNHTARKIGATGLTMAAAKAKVSSDIDVESSRLTIIPRGYTKEALAYEFTGTYEGSTYYVYIDAVSGRQIEMFKVVASTEGTMLM